MAQPPAYNKSTNFANYAAANPSAPFPAASTDSEFSAVETTLDATLTNLALLQRDDGRIKNQTVHPDSLTPATVAMLGDWNPRGLWTTGTAYAVRDMVEQASASYVCVVAHTAGASFAIDQAAVKWIALDGLNALAASSGSSLVGFIQSGTGAATGTVQGELRKIVRASQFNGANFGLKLQQAHDSMPATGGIIDCTDTQGTQTTTANITITKPVKIYLGGLTLALGTYQIIIRRSGASIYGIGKQDENNSPTLITYSGTSSAIILQHATTATPIFGNVLADFEIAATGSAGTSATAIGVALHGARYSELRNLSVFNFASGKAMYFTGNGAVINGFGATNYITNPFVSTCAFGIYTDNAGGSESTHGVVTGGLLTATHIACESWRISDLDIGPVTISSPGNDTVFVAPRFELAVGATAITINSGVTDTKIIAPTFISGATFLSDSGSKTEVIAAAGNAWGDTVGVDSKLESLQSKRAYSRKGTTATLAVGAFEDIFDTAAGGIWLVSVRMADGGTTWRAFAVAWGSGASVTVASLSSNLVTVGSSGTQLRLTNGSGTDSIALAWSILKLEGAAQ